MAGGAGSHHRHQRRPCQQGEEGEEEEESVGRVAEMSRRIALRCLDMEQECLRRERSQTRLFQEQLRGVRQVWDGTSNDIELKPGRRRCVVVGGNLLLVPGRERSIAAVDSRHTQSLDDVSEIKLDRA